MNELLVAGAEPCQALNSDQLPPVNGPHAHRDVPLRDSHMAGIMPRTADDEVILVDRDDQCLGFAPKLAAHQDGGALHRAFSVFICNAAGQILLQQRAADKYHFSGRWSNACCSHPHCGEGTAQAAQRRLREEFGFSVELCEIFSFIYCAEDAATGLTEHEYDHVFVGRFDGTPDAAAEEIAAWRWVDVAELIEDVKRHADHYTPWLRTVLHQVVTHPRCR